MAHEVAVLTDSTASIPEEMIRELKIRTVAYYIHRGEEVLRDLVTIQREEFLNWLITARALPTTASPGPGDYLEAYKELAEEGHDEIISIHMTSKGSGAYQAAKVAQSMLEEEEEGVHVEVIDTLNVSLCQGWMAIEAARAALEGLRLEEVSAKVKRMIPVTHMIQTADTLKVPNHGRANWQSDEPVGLAAQHQAVNRDGRRRDRASGGGTRAGTRLPGDRRQGGRDSGEEQSTDRLCARGGKTGSRAAEGAGGRKGGERGILRGGTLSRPGGAQRSRDGWLVLLSCRSMIEP